MTTNMNISGNFDTTNLELKSVADFMRKMDIPVISIEKFGHDKDGHDTNAKGAGDIYVKCFDYTTLLFEIKEESDARIEKYNQLGIDFISVFKFKEGMGHKGIHKPSEYRDFMASIDRTAAFKWGKIGYSNSDVWLFYCRNKDGSYMFLDGYDFKKMQEEHFFEQMMISCEFAVNNKPNDQLSSKDNWMSAVYYVDRDMMERYRIHNAYDLYHGGNFTARAMFGGIMPTPYDFTVLTRSKDKNKVISEASMDSLKWILSDRGQASGCDKIPELPLVRKYVELKRGKRI